MSKKQEQGEPVMEAPVTRKRVEMKDVALSIVKLPAEVADDGVVLKPARWNLVRIKFDLDSGQVGDVSLEEQEDLGFAIERFNLAVEQEINPHEGKYEK